MQSIRKNDTVLVLTGKDRGKTGVVREVRPRKSRLIIDGVNMITKHQRPTQSGAAVIPGGILNVEGPVHVSNVMVVCKECQKATRTSARQRADGVKVRVCKRCGADID